MSKKKKQQPLEPTTTVSSGDCTGLMAALPQSEQQAEAYEEIYPTHRARESKDNGRT